MSDDRGHGEEASLVAEIERLLRGMRPAEDAVFALSGGRIVKYRSCFIVGLTEPIVYVLRSPLESQEAWMVDGEILRGLQSAVTCIERKFDESTEEQKKP